MKEVYLLKSIPSPHRRYIGIADNAANRLLEHNSGESFHTAKYRPWKTVVVVRFEDDKKPGRFERYLKSGSGRAFATVETKPLRIRRSMAVQKGFLVIGPCDAAPRPSHHARLCCLLLTRVAMPTYARAQPFDHREN